jgi:6-phosphogluconolactonase
MSSIQVLPDAANLAWAGAEHFIARARAAIDARGQFTVALTSGSLSRTMCEALAHHELIQQVDWSCVHLFFGDERCVPPDQPASTYRMVRNALVDHVPLPPGHVHRMHGEDPPALAALAYESELRSVFRRPTVPRFDLVLLTMGEDGRVVSLVPGLPVTNEHKNWTVACYIGEVGTWCLTLTPAVLNAAAEVTVLVAGTRNAVALKQVLEGPYQPNLLPAQLVRPADGSLLWMVDEAAAAELTPAGVS